jgi:hypothetical protein
MASDRRRRQSRRTDGSCGRARPVGWRARRVVIELDAAIVEEAGERRPSGKRVADRLGQPPVPRNAAELLFEPGLHGRDQRSRLDIARVSAVLGRAAPDARSAAARCSRNACAVPASSSPIIREYPATSAARMAAKRRWTGCFNGLFQPHR